MEIALWWVGFSILVGFISLGEAVRSLAASLKDVKQPPPAPAISKEIEQALQAVATAIDRAREARK